MSEKSVLECGTTVLIIGTPLEGRTEAVCIRGNVVTYEVSWFAGEDFHVAWLSEHRVKPKDSQTREKRISLIGPT